MYFYRLCLKKNGIQKKKGILGESQNKLLGGGGGAEAVVNTLLLPILRPKIVIQIGITTVNFRQLENCGVRNPQVPPPFLSLILMPSPS